MGAIIGRTDQNECPGRFAIRSTKIHPVARDEQGQNRPAQVVERVPWVGKRHAAFQGCRAHLFALVERLKQALIVGNLIGPHGQRRQRFQHLAFRPTFRCILDRFFVKKIRHSRCAIPKMGGGGRGVRSSGCSPELIVEPLENDRLIKPPDMTDSGGGEFAAANHLGHRPGMKLEDVSDFSDGQDFHGLLPFCSILKHAFRSFQLGIPRKPSIPCQEENSRKVTFLALGLPFRP